MQVTSSCWTALECPPETMPIRAARHGRRSLCRPATRARGRVESRALALARASAPPPRPPRAACRDRRPFQRLAEGELDPEHTRDARFRRQIRHHRELDGRDSGRLDLASTGTLTKKAPMVMTVTRTGGVVLIILNGHGGDPPCGVSPRDYMRRCPAGSFFLCGQIVPLQRPSRPC